MEMMRGRCSIILALLPLAFSPSKGAIMEVGGVTECPAEGGMYNCRQMSVDFDALLAAEEVTIEGSGALVGLVFGRDITISRDQVYEGHMYTYTVPRGVAAFLYDDSMGYGQLTGNVRVGRRFFQVQNCGENCHVFGRVNSNAPRLFGAIGGRAESLDRQTACSNGDALSFAECWAAKQIGMCSVNLWITQCEATCGNDCCGDSNFDSCASLAGLTFADIKIGCDLFQGNSICRASCEVC